MKETLLNNLPQGMKASISRCLSPTRGDVYRLLELGLYKGAECTILQKNDALKAIEIAMLSSRLCINNELASQFMVTFLSKG
jgi:Fe2+ transport system protein FeoA